MAITKNTKGIDMQVISNHGEVEGKTLRSRKTYNDVKSEATDDAVYGTFECIKNMQQPLAEECVKITSETLIKTV
ncbi:MAG: DUF1659 domain-containing protein [Eubacterium sp.]